MGVVFYMKCVNNVFLFFYKIYDWIKETLLNCVVFLWFRKKVRDFCPLNWLANFFPSNHFFYNQFLFLCFLLCVYENCKLYNDFYLIFYGKFFSSCASKSCSTLYQNDGSHRGCKRYTFFKWYANIHPSIYTKIIILCFIVYCFYNIISFNR